jgi:thiol-disulfide isomerase/thioredoxin
MRFRVFTVVLLLSSLSLADIVEDVRSTLAQGDFAAAESQLKGYQAQHGVDPLYLEALSWLARAALTADKLDAAQTYAKQTETLAKPQLAHRKLDAEPHLPLALGAAIEVGAQILAQRGKKAEAVALLRHDLLAYRNTSIEARLQKNLNLLHMSGELAPALSVSQYLGTRPSPLSQLKGSPVLLFFWAHWCGDCKNEGPIISRLRAEYAGKGLTVMAPTQLYGYAAYGQDASPKDELDYIGRVWQQYYHDLQSAPVPVSKANFNAYGASTTPTLVLIDRKGRVALYHPGLMSYADLRAAIEKVVSG